MIHLHKHYQCLLISTKSEDRISVQDGGEQQSIAVGISSNSTPCAATCFGSSSANIPCHEFLQAENGLDDELSRKKFGFLSLGCLDNACRC